MNTEDPNIVRIFSLAAAVLKSTSLELAFPEADSLELLSLERSREQVLAYLQRFGWEEIALSEKAQPIPSGYKVSWHALKRYQEHFPDSQESDVVHSILSGTPLSRSFVRDLLGRHRSDEKSSYVVNATRQGVFVLVDHTVVTYIRLAPSQMNLTWWEKL